MGVVLEAGHGGVRVVGLEPPKTTRVEILGPS